MLRPFFVVLALLGLAGCPGCTVVIGRPCTAATGCGAALYACDTSFDGGYCTRACIVEGDLSSCEFSAEQQDGICGLHSDAGLECARNCVGDAGCPGTLRCVAVPGGAGVGACVP